MSVSICCQSYIYGCHQIHQRSRDSCCWYVTLVDPKNAPRGIPSAATCVARRVDRAERASESATQLHLSCMHVFDSTPSSCYLCIHSAHNHIDHDLSYDYDVRQTDLPKHAPSVTTPLYDNPVGPPAIEARNLDVDRGRPTGISETTEKNLTSRSVRYRR
jgi:hypothetical protein